MTLTERLRKYIEARRAFNELSDAIYAIGAGNLDDSRFGIIIDNYTEEMMIEVMEITQHINDDKVRKYFPIMTLDLSQYGETQVYIGDETRKITVDTLVNTLMLMDGYPEDF